VATAGLAFLGAVIFAVFVGQLLVQRMAASDFSALLFEFSLGGVSLRHHVLDLFQRLRGKRGGICFLVIIPGFVRCAVVASVYNIPRVHEPGLVELNIVWKVNASGAGGRRNEGTERGVMGRCAAGRSLPSKWALFHGRCEGAVVLNIISAGL
jgi:hypothetical protein